MPVLVPTRRETTAPQRVPQPRPDGAVEATTPLGRNPIDGGAAAPLSVFAAISRRGWGPGVSGSDPTV